MAIANTIRGPKKKKGGPAKSEVAESNNIVQIFKDRDDITIYPSDMYPDWLMEMVRNPHYNSDETMIHMYRGERIPDCREAYQMSRNIRRKLYSY